MTHRRRRVYRAGNPYAARRGRGVHCTLLDPFDSRVVWRGDVYDSAEYLWGGTYRGWTSTGERIRVVITYAQIKWCVGSLANGWTVRLRERD